MVQVLRVSGDRYVRATAGDVGLCQYHEMARKSSNDVPNILALQRENSGSMVVEH
jgi:hypothetical protein